MKLTQRLLTIYILLTILPLLAVGALAGYIGRRAIENQVYERLTAISNLKQRELHRWENESISTISLLGQRPLVTDYAGILVEAQAFDLLTPEQKEAYDHLINDHFEPTLNMRSSFNDLLLIRAADGQILAATEKDLEGLFRENRGFFKQGLEGPHIEIPKFSIRSQELVIHVSAPVLNASGEPIAVVVGHLNIPELVNIISEYSQFSESEDSYLVDANHYFITEPRFGSGFQYTQTVFTEGVNRCVDEKQSGRGKYVDYRGEVVLGAFTWLEDDQMCAVSEIDLAEINQDIRQLQTTSLGISLLMIVVMLVFGLAFSRDLLSAIRTLEDGTKAITMGDLTFRIQSSRKDEFGLLAQRFNDMTETLENAGQKNQQLIEQLNMAKHNLETQVQERTKELTDAQMATLNMMEDLVKNQEALARKTTELERSNQELEQFAYVASHDLQEPLRMISSYLQLIERRYKDHLDEDANEFIDFAVSGASRMKQLINDLLTFSRVGTRGSAFVPVSSQEVFNQVYDNLQFAIEDAQADVQAQSLPDVMADETQLAQLLQNLIGNALKFRNETAPRIEVRARPTQSDEGEDMWEFAVEDNGIGIEEQYFERIFIVFQRLHNGEAYPGTGIGLSICKKIVERHGGRIWLESTPGEGTTFYFTLKAA